MGHNSCMLLPGMEHDEHEAGAVSRYQKTQQKMRSQELKEQQRELKDLKEQQRGAGSAVGSGRSDAGARRQRETAAEAEAAAAATAAAAEGKGKDTGGGGKDPSVGGFMNGGTGGGGKDSVPLPFSLLVIAHHRRKIIEAVTANKGGSRQKLVDRHEVGLYKLNSVDT
jgi:hypothetical protein